MKKLSTFLLLVACCIACSKDDPKPSIMTMNMNIDFDGSKTDVTNITAKKRTIGDVEFVEISGDMWANDQITITIPYNKVESGGALEICCNDGQVRAFVNGWFWVSGATYGTQPGSVIEVTENEPGKKIKGSFNVILQMQANNVNLVFCKGNFEINY